VVLRFIWPSVSPVHFEVTSDSLKFHANETSDLGVISAHLHSLSRTLQRKEINRADISFALSSSMRASHLKEFVPGSLGHLKDIKLNFGNTNIGNEGAEYLVNILPLSVEKLDLSLDSINSDVRLGKIIGTGIARLTHLK
jgi:hypothetical protein